MRLIVTGGGTGGHVFPALEVARLARAEGWDVLYLGSNRGQERRACEKANIPFRGFPSEPLYSLKKPRGWLAAINLFRATAKARPVSTLQAIPSLSIEPLAVSVIIAALGSDL